MTSPLVSIVIPTFNSERFLRECLDSVINQDYANLEIIIVDGSSDDQTLVILQEYSRIISTLISEDDTGIYNAINKGICIAKGDLIKILNSDDVLEFDSIKKVVNVYSSLKNPRTEDVLIMGWLQRIDENSNAGRIWGRKDRVGYFENLLHPSWFMSKSVYNNLGLYDESYRIASDYDYYLKVLTCQCVNIVKMPEVLVRYRSGGTSQGFAGKSEVVMIKRKYKGFLLSVMLKTQIDLIILINKLR